MTTDVQAAVEDKAIKSTTTQEALNDTTNHSLQSILERNVLISNFTWNSDDVTVPITLNLANLDEKRTIGNYDFPQSIFDKSDVIIEKVKNFQYFKSDVEIEVKVNAQPFQQGALLIVYNPYFNVVSDMHSKGTEFLPSLTTCPSTVLNLENSNAVKMTLPFANEFDMFDLDNSDNQFGTILIYVLSPIRDATDSTSVTVQILARFVNPKLMTATNDTSLGRKHEKRMYEKYAKRMNLVAQGKEENVQGPISKVGDAVGTIGETLSGVPVIGSVASTVGWVGRSVSKLASAFGWSKPVDNIIATNVINRPGYSIPHVEGHDHSVTLGMLNDNCISVDKVVPEEVDEMSLEHVLQKQNVINVYSVSKDQFVANAKLFSFKVAPVHDFQKQNYNDKDYHFYGSLGYTCSLFKYWRGGLDFSLNVIKTQFHSGRYVIVYAPHGSDLPANLDQGLTNNYSAIVDLTDKSKEPSPAMTFTIPYISNVPWRNIGQDIGTIGVYALSDLVCPDTVSTRIDFVLSIAGSKDFQVAFPYSILEPTSRPPSFTQADFDEYLKDMAKYPKFSWQSDIDDLYAVDDSESETFLIGTLEGSNIVYTFPGQYSSVSATVPSGTLVSLTGVPNGETATLSPKIEMTGEGKVRVVWSTNTTGDWSNDVSGTAAYSNFPTLELFAQGYIELTEPGNNVPLTSFKTEDVNQSTMGEYCNSLRALIKRAGRVGSLSSSGSLQPFPIQLNSATGMRGNNMLSSTRALVSYLYRFGAGSTNYKVFVNKPTAIIGTEVSITGGYSSNHLAKLEGTTRAQFDYNPVVNQFLELRIPYYCKTRCICMGSRTTGDYPCINYDAVDASGCIVYESAGDDTTFFFMIGPPVMQSLKTVALPELK